MKVAQFLGNCFFLSGIFFRQFQALPPGCPAYLVPYATSSLIVHTIWVGRFRFDCTVSLTVVCGQRKEGAVMVFILSKIKCFFRLLQSAALQLTVRTAPRFPNPPERRGMPALPCPAMAYWGYVPISFISCYAFASKLFCGFSAFTTSSPASGMSLFAFPHASL